MTVPLWVHANHGPVPEPEPTLADLVHMLEGIGCRVYSRYGELRAVPVTRQEVIVLPDAALAASEPKETP